MLDYVKHMQYNIGKEKGRTLRRKDYESNKLF